MHALHNAANAAFNLISAASERLAAEVKEPTIMGQIGLFVGASYVLYRATAPDHNMRETRSQAINMQAAKATTHRQPLSRHASTQTESSDAKNVSKKTRKVRFSDEVEAGKQKSLEAWKIYAGTGPLIPNPTRTDQN